MPERLRLLAHPDRPACRSRACSAPARTRLGFCPDCQAVYDAARALRARLLERDGRRLAATQQDLLAALAPDERHRLLEHLAARSAHHRDHGADVTLAALADYLDERRGEHTLDRLAAVLADLAPDRQGPLT